MLIRKIPINKINPAPYNPRKDLQPGDPEYQKLLKSLDEFDCVEPLVWNCRSGNLVGGHQRFKILSARGDKHVHCSVVDLSPEKEKALNLALNKISGDWDNQKLAQLLDELIKEPDFDFEVTGFDLPEATRLIDDILMPDSSGEENFDIDSELRNITRPITKRGEIIELGPHRLLCGDSTRKRNIDKLFGDEKPDLIFTDPPYGIDYIAIKDKAKVSNDTSKSLARLLKVVADTNCNTKYVCGHWKSFGYYEKVLAPPAALIVWNKSQQFSSMKGHNFHLYNPRHEFIFYYGSQKHKAGLYEENVWNIPNEISIDHPTIKPVSLCIRAIRNSSVKNGIVFDPFLGSGSTLIATERLGRRCFGIELEPKYCDVIVRRYIATVGKISVSRKLAERYCPKEVAI
ncbi:MAG: DNA modification methylase [Planctomycetes bacterium]|nr:DNA modification methylase [Planctomycetota bacterium]